MDFYKLLINDSNNRYFEFVNEIDLPATVDKIVIVKGDNVIFLYGTTTELTLRTVQEAFFRRAKALGASEQVATHLATHIENVKKVENKEITTIWFDPELDKSLIDELNQTVVIDNQLLNFKLVSNCSDFVRNINI